jgi:hypothetical protein
LSLLFFPLPLLLLFFLPLLLFLSAFQDGSQASKQEDGTTSLGRIPNNSAFYSVFFFIVHLLHVVIIILSELITVTIAYNYWFLLNQELFSVLFIGAHIVSLTIMR